MHEEPSSSGDCCFCREFSTGHAPLTISAATALTDRIALSARGFKVLPTLSPLVEGHVLIVPQRHVTSLAQLANPEKADFFAVLANVVGLVRDLWGGPVVFEHGVGQNKKGGCGVTHAHLHVVPIPDERRPALWARMDRELGKPAFRAGLSDALDGLQPRSSYLIASDNIAETRCYISDNLQSQLMRRLVAESMDFSVWDWRQSYNWDAFINTYNRLHCAA